MTPRCGLVLLTGGQGARLGGPKHDRPHPGGGSWGGHLVRVFRAAVTDGPVQLVGAPLPDLPGLPRIEDPRQGPAVALSAWAAAEPPASRRGWVAACDQVHWTPEAFAAWLAEAEAADPEGRAWTLVRREDRRQPLGGIAGATLIPHLAVSTATSLHALLVPLPVLELPGAAWAGADLDTPEDLAAFRPAPGRPARP